MTSNVSSLMREPMHVLTEAYHNAYGKDWPKGNLNKAAIVKELAVKGITINRRGANASVNGGRTIKNMKNVRTAVRACVDALYEGDANRIVKTLNAGDTSVQLVAIRDENGQYTLTINDGKSEQQFSDFHDAYPILKATFSL